MRRHALRCSQQHSFSFTRLDIWQSIPVDNRRQCRELCEQMLRVALQDQEQADSEVTCDRKDPPRAS